MFGSFFCHLHPCIQRKYCHLVVLLDWYLPWLCLCRSRSLRDIEAEIIQRLPIKQTSHYQNQIF